MTLTACHRDRSETTGADASPLVASPPGSLPARFSRPIAATRGHDGSVIVAGLAASRGAIVVAELGEGGLTRWTVDALSEVAWSANGELHAFPSADGVVVVYRGLQRGQTVTQAVGVDSKGRISSPAFAVGGAACATDTTLAWIDGVKGGAARVSRRDWGQESAVTVLTIPSEREPALVCGSHRLFALGEGEQDLTLVIGGTSATLPMVVARDRDFADEEREHDTFAVEDTLGIVRVGRSGRIAIREVSVEQRGPWRRLATRLDDTDDVVAVDADADAFTVIYTRDDNASCDGAGASRVRALRASKATTEEQTVDLAPVECGTDEGPFWTGALATSFVVAWVERSAMHDPRAPPIVGLAYRALSRAALGELQRVPLGSDELVDAGCDKDRCYAVALVRAPGTDDTEPELVQSIAYP